MKKRTKKLLRLKHNLAVRIAFRHRLGGRDFDVDIEAPTPGTTVLFGPSGAGKSTIVAVTAGLLRPAQCLVAIDDIILADTSRNLHLPPERRRIGMVFQDALLFPHLSVAANLRYGWRRARERRISWDEVIDLLGLADLLARRPATLSGGERQRVAIGRALLAQPRLLALDEPLASLDAPRRADILPYLARLRDALSLPILYITHAIEEVTALADTLVLVEAGRIVASGPLAALTARGDLPLARRGDAAAVIDCLVAEHLPDRGLTRLELNEGASLLMRLTAHPIGAKVRARLPAGEIILARVAPNQISVHNILPVRIARTLPDGEAGALVELSLGQDFLLARITRDAVDNLVLCPGESIFALIKSVAVSIL